MMAGRIRVLYVDDEPDLPDICKLFLEQSGDFSVATIDSAPGARELLKLEQFDAIVSDYQMKGRTPDKPQWMPVHEDGSDFPAKAHPAMVALQTGKEVRDVVMGIRHPEKEEMTGIRINAVPQFRPGEDTPYQVYTAFDDITGTVCPAGEF